MNNTILNRRTKKYIQCKRCNSQMPRNRTQICNKYKNEQIGNRTEGRNLEDGYNQYNILQEQVRSINTLPQIRINDINYDMKNQGFIDSIKHEDCVRILIMNPRGFGPNNNEKVEMMIQSIIEYQIDGILLSALDQKWSSNKIDRLKNAFKKVNQEVEIIASDSGQEARTENGYLPKGTLKILIGWLAGLRVKDKDKYDELGRWSSFELEGNNKTV